MSAVTFGMRALSALIVGGIVVLAVMQILDVAERWLDRRLADRRYAERMRAARTRERLAEPATQRQAEIEQLNDKWRVS